jgi:hypothetical protein
MAYGSLGGSYGMAGMTPGFDSVRSDTASSMLGGMASAEAERQNQIAMAGLNAMGQVQTAKIGADAMKQQAEAQQRASMWGALGSIGGAAATAGIAAITPPKLTKLKILG